VFVNVTWSLVEFESVAVVLTVAVYGS